MCQMTHNCTNTYGHETITIGDGWRLPVDCVRSIDMIFHTLFKVFYAVPGLSYNNVFIGILSSEPTLRGWLYPTRQVAMC